MRSHFKRLGLSLLPAVTMILFALPALAGSVSDADADLVPDGFDNCSTRANGPNDASNQVDADQDGFGNVCDADANNDCATTTLDFPFFLDPFVGTSSSLEFDFNGDGAVTTLDFTLFLSFFTSGAPPGPSGLSCAICPSPPGTPCLP